MADTRVLQRVMSRWFSPNSGVSDAVIHRLHTKEAKYIRLELSLLRIVDCSMAFGKMIRFSFDKLL